MSEMRDTMSNFDYIKENYLALSDEIKGYEKKYGRSITLVAVTKSGSDEELVALAEAGVTDIGENRPTELKRRSELLASLGFTPRLHEIGNLQRNKVKLVIDRAELIHSVGRIELAREISRQAVLLGKRISVLMEINSADEDAKGGVSLDNAETLLAEMRLLPMLDIKGIMTMGPCTDDIEELRPYFRKTRALYDLMKKKYGFEGDGILSMGMSDSYRVAIEEGSTLVRVGRRIFKK